MMRRRDWPAVIIGAFLLLVAALIVAGTIVAGSVWLLLHGWSLPAVIAVGLGGMLIGLGVGQWSDRGLRRAYRALSTRMDLYQSWATAADRERVGPVGPRPRDRGSVRLDLPAAVLLLVVAVTWAVVSLHGWQGVPWL